ncbi:hypothetical protein Agabi119p4_770 [Agaricus bisporus var. burnettii]|uniref:AB hydrolase-1 domain-containing protein n=1 Tax=Agaricus bisporus var. burnettii TaxID=192524 RepID=A0A8H7FB46_AGABI|nr:hypothetical protein Agabi119p4_770 [Agaricus bisporus var. burnettii]
MDSSSYKDFITSRGYNYHYYFAPGQETKPTLLLLHGFPSLANDWHNQVTSLRAHGYGFIVPDMLGYGGTAKPTDANDYKQSLMVKDLIDILDAEKITRCVVIGHDWGSIVTARLANYYPDRFLGFGFLAVGYLPPNPAHTYEDTLELMRKSFGSERLGYQSFFAEPDGHILCEKNFDTFYSIVHPKDYGTIWPQALYSLGETRKWIERNVPVEIEPSIPEEEHAYKREQLKKSGLRAAMCWYTVSVKNLELEEIKQIPHSAYTIEKPVFLGLTEKDPLCPPAISKPSAEQFCKNVTIKVFDCGHWIFWEKRDEFNKELAAWLETLGH